MDLHERTAGQWWQHQEKFVTVKLDSARVLMSTVYEKLGASPDNAKFYMNMSLDKAIQGDHARGVIRILNFVRGVQGGHLSLNPEIKILKETSNFALVDGGKLAAGPMVSKVAMELAIKKARNTGIAFGAAQGQAQILTLFTRMAVDAGMVGIVFNQSFPTVAPFGGAGALLGNQPLAVGVPAGRHDPVLFDASMTQSSASGMFLAAKQGQTVDPGLLLDEHGMPTTDATEFPSKAEYVDPVLGPDARGTLTALGDNHKGYGLVFILCLLSAVLSDTSPPWELYYRLKEKRGRYGSVMIAIDPAVVMPLDKFKAQVDAFIDTVKASPRRAGVKEILYPGEKSQRLKREREQANMIAIPESHYKGLCTVADEFGLKRPELV
jgi:LDH2 family malate/lactate/ureidoglycolate dehydrogenase